MLTCFIRYVVDPSKIKEFEEYARAWITLITKHGGIHHGYFLPEDDLVGLPNQAFSFPDLGKTGPENIAVALFSFPSLEVYETYKKSVAKDKECERITAEFKETKCFLSYERNFLRPILEEAV